MQRIMQDTAVQFSVEGGDVSCTLSRIPTKLALKRCSEGFSGRLVSQ